MNPEADTTSDSETRSAEQGRAMEAEIPDLVRAAGWDSVGQLAENSCLGDPDPEQASRETHWTGASGRVGVSREDAESAAERIQDAAERRGWEHLKRGNTAPNSENLYAAAKGDLTLNVTYTSGTGRPGLSLQLSTECLEMPAGHTMIRSVLDPMYGSADPLYPNDDRSKFTNGEPKPLPGPSDGSPSAGH
ncbi:hypothetical protein ACFFIO_12755 [Citricoccus parietis]|uniref:Uncharacterized protein n=2 Tax=Citricoccus parietis TaxID=592307 RepID=A0ABV6F765_9MICC